MLIIDFSPNSNKILTKNSKQTYFKSVIKDNSCFYHLIFSFKKITEIFFKTKKIILNLYS